MPSLGRDAALRQLAKLRLSEVVTRKLETDTRAVPGLWAGVLTIGLQRSAIGTLAEIATRFTMLIHLPRARWFTA